MRWSFAFVNNRLAEIYYERKKDTLVFLGHAYVDESEFTTKTEKKWIQKDTKVHNFIYRKRKYKSKLTGKIYAMKKP